MTSAASRVIRALSSLVVLAGLPVAASAQPQPAVPAVVATGQATVRRAPDRAFITATVESRATSPRDAQRTNAGVMTGVLQKLRDGGIPKEAIRTVSLTVEPEYDFTAGRRTLRGYVARNTIEVRVDEIDRVGDVLDTAVNSGATSAGDVRFDLKNRAGAEREALRQAVDDARGRAEALAAGGAVSLGVILRIQEEGTEAGVPRPVTEMMAMRAAGPVTPVNVGEIEIRARVTLTVSVTTLTASAK
jgi:uncharacterized protein YggE